MSNIQYSLLIIGALSLLLGLSLGQIHDQHQRIEQLEFNRFRQSGNTLHLHHCQSDFCRSSHAREATERRVRQAVEHALRQMEIQAELQFSNEQVEQKMEEAVRRYNKKLQRWEDKWQSTDVGLHREMK